MVKIVPTRRFPLIIQPRKHRQQMAEILDIVGASAGDCAEFTLPDEPLAEIRV